MKRLIFPIIFSLFLILFPTLTFAKMLPSKDLVVVSKDEVIDDDLFVSGQTVTINGTVNGDLYAAGGSVTINGIINGDVLAAGGVLDISGTIADDLRVAGGSLRIHGAIVGDNASVFGGNVTLDEDTKIVGSLIFGSGSLVSQASIDRGVVGGAGNINLDAPILKDVRIGSESITLGSNAVVSGDLIYTSPNKIKMVDTATVAGQIKQILPEEMKNLKDIDVDVKVKTGLEALNKVRGIFKVWSYLSALVVGFLMLYLFKKPSKEMLGLANKKLAAIFGWGSLVLFLSFPLLLVIFLTGIGIPLALILLGLLLIDIYMAKIVVGIVVGQMIDDRFFSKKLGSFLNFALGLAAFYILTYIPWFGGFFKLIGLIFGLGILSLCVKGYLIKTKK